MLCPDESQRPPNANTFILPSSHPHPVCADLLIKSEMTLYLRVCGDSIFVTIRGHSLVSYGVCLCLRPQQHRRSVVSSCLVSNEDNLIAPHSCHLYLNGLPACSPALFFASSSVDTRRKMHKNVMECNIITDRICIRMQGRSR